MLTIRRIFGFRNGQTYFQHFCFELAVFVTLTNAAVLFREEKMKNILTPKWFIIKLTGILFAVFSAYNGYIFFTGRGLLTREAMLISALVALLFALLALFSWTSEFNKSVRFIFIRKTGFIIVLFTVFALKMRLALRVIGYIDFSRMNTVLYGCSYFMTQIALLLLLIYYAFVVKDLPKHRKSAILLPMSAMLLFLLSLAADMVLFFGLGINLESSPMRTMIFRPVFYLSFTGLSAYFMFTPKIEEVPTILV